jgi:hypothetical protein
MQVLNNAARLQVAFKLLSKLDVLTLRSFVPPMAGKSISPGPEGTSLLTPILLNT